MQRVMNLLYRADPVAEQILENIGNVAKKIRHYSFKTIEALYFSLKRKKKHHIYTMPRDDHGRVASAKKSNERGNLDFSYFKATKSKEVLEFEERTVQNFLKVVGIGSTTAIGHKIGSNITVYAFRLQEGVLPSKVLKGSKLKDYENDLASLLNLKGSRVAKITAPSYDWGNNSYAIEVTVTNKEQKLVKLEEMLTSKEFWSFKGDLVLPIGKSIGGYVYVDLEELPHMLVAGTTKSGKSVGLNSMILGLMHRNRPSEVKIAIVDPAGTEFTMFENSKYLYGSIVTSTNDSLKLLEKLVLEMEKRLETFSNNKVKNIAMYNAIATSTMPKIVVVIDELAQMMERSKNECETYIMQLAQLARKTGIHLIIATQRPNVKVISGNIKANLDTRLSYRIKTATDSITILDEAGANELQGKGDAYLSVGGDDKVRLQAPYINEKNLKKVVI